MLLVQLEDGKIGAINPDGMIYGQTDCTTLWHLAYTQGIFDIKKKYENHLKKSNMHTPDYLKNWSYAHLFGKYPKTEVKLTDIPEVILKNFNIDKDEFYFKDRLIEVKHFIDSSHWKGFFNPKTAIEFGCGLGPRVLAMNLMGIDTEGIELSKFAVGHSYIPDKIKQGNVLNKLDKQYDLVIAYDLLEHIDYKDLDKAIENIINSSNQYILISVPVIGDPNLELDKTHKIKENKEWWIKKFLDKGLTQMQVPEYFLFKEQLMIFKK